MNPHCRIGKIRLKGSRNITTRLPAKALKVYHELREATRPSSLGKQRGRE